MRIAVIALALPIAAAPAWAQTPVDHATIANAGAGAVVAGLEAFSESADTLEDALRETCENGDWSGVQARYRDTYAAWAAVDFARFGPMEERSTALSVNFWPDKKNFVGRALRAARSGDETQQSDPAFLRAQSVAVQGLPALERLLFDTAPGDRCPLVTTIAVVMRDEARGIVSDWRGDDGWAALMQAPGAGNPVYRDAPEVTASLYHALDFGLEYLQQQRLSRPYGEEGRARPRSGEAWRSQQGLANARAQLAGLRQFSTAVFAPAMGRLDARTLDGIWDDVVEEMDRIPSPLSEAVTTSAGRESVGRTISRLGDLRKWLSVVLAPKLGIGLAFNSSDGD